MSKLKQHINDAQKQLIKIKERSQKYVPGTINLQILGSGAPGAPASVYLFTDQSRYLFNCGEGTQRLAHEHRTKLTRLEHIFISQRSWQRIGGLPGLSLTIQDAGVPNITLHGPDKLLDVFLAMRRFVILKQLRVDAPECKKNEYYEDSVLKVHYLPLSDGINTKDYNAMAFICECKPRPGALNVQKCVKLGVPKGPMLGILKNGESVTLTKSNGESVTIMPEDVRDPDDEGPSFLVIDCPTVGHLKSLIENERFDEYLKNNSEASEREDLVLHFSSASVMGTDDYKQFVELFSKSTKHLLLNEQNKFSGYVASHRLQWQLNQLNENIFPILKEPIPKIERDDLDFCTKKIKLTDPMEAKSPTSENNNQPTLNNTSSMTCFHLRPKIFMDRSLEAIVNPDEFIKEIMDIEGVAESLENLKQINSQSPPADRSNQYPKVVFLGTGSCIPNKTRNVSSICLHTTKDTCILLDAGEGTCGQIYRFYGKEANDVILKIKAVYISHLHADHHIGLFGIIQMRQKLLCDRNDPILLIAPGEMKSWFSFYDSDIESISSEFEFIDNRALVEENLCDAKATQLGIGSFRTCGVIHCPNAFGAAIIINQNQPFKITYSGDTKPCDSLIELGANSTLLIHEATMEDELYEDALAKMHSTVSQAIEQGHKMNAKFILLTHFSQRYAKIPRIEQHLVENVGIAFDNMEVVPSDLNDLNTLYPTMKKMFAEHWDEMEQKSIKRANKKAAIKISDAN